MRIFLQLLVVSRFDSSNRDKQRREKRGKMRKGRIHVIHCLGVFAAVATIGRKWCSLPKVAPPTLFCTLTSSHFKSNKNLGRSFDQQLIRCQFVGKQCNCRTAQSLKNKLQDIVYIRNSKYQQVFGPLLSLYFVCKKNIFWHFPCCSVIL